MKTTPNDIKKKKGKGKIIALTAYDYSFAKIFDEAGVDIILVGDTVGMVCQGEKDTKSVTIESGMSSRLPAGRRLTFQCPQPLGPIKDIRAPEPVFPPEIDPYCTGTAERQAMCSTGKPTRPRTATRLHPECLPRIR